MFALFYDFVRYDYYDLSGETIIYAPTGAERLDDDDICCNL